ncbi:sigma-70 family RNA polymerase sigma factor [Leifsonia sp. NPDC058292]|uniref:sigma-70 family RNA polymerase sigma factor n=1 Tax=Leifsonia sp. NPDC058292 TaxID=3346428 RepID=UPI0036DC6B08
MPAPSTPDFHEPSDSELVERARRGDKPAYGLLWSRHAGAARRVAQSTTTSFDGDDIVSEAFARVYQAILGGGGPTTGFRPYLFTVVRNVAAAWGRGRREVAVENFDTLESNGLVKERASSEDEVLQKLDRGLTAQAFRSLPERWQEALWYSEIEQLSRKDMAQIFGISSAAVGVLTFRAREGLRQAWVQAHLTSEDLPAECRWTVEHLGAHARDALGSADEKRLKLHLAECARCTIIASDAHNVGKWLSFVILPLIIGIGAATAYTSAVRGGSTATYALGVDGIPHPMDMAQASSSGAATSPDIEPSNVVRVSSRRPKLRRRVIQAAAGAAAVTGIVAGIFVANASSPSTERQPSKTGAAEVASPPPPSASGTLTARLVQGDGEIFLPSASGTGAPDATVIVRLGDTQLAETIVHADGTWLTDQLPVSAAGELTVTEDPSARDSTSIVLPFSLKAPTVTETRTAGGVTLAVRGRPNSPIHVTVDLGGGESVSIAAALLDADGTWSATYGAATSGVTAPEAHVDVFALTEHDAGIFARYAAGNRFGLSSPAAVSG